MKTLTLFVFLLACLTLSAAQTLSEGSVVGLEVIPAHSNPTWIYDLELCCGIPSGKGGYLGNGFAIANGELTASFKAPSLPNTYYVTGQIADWFTPQAISPYCSVQSATLTNVTVSLGSKQLSANYVGEYVQAFCQRDGVGWSGPGGLTIHAQ